MAFIEEILLSLSKSEYFSSLQLRWRNHQMVLDDESIPKTTFITTDGKYEFLGVPFGFVQAPARFQEMMDRVLQKL